MKNKKKGYYVALYGSLGTVMAIAAVVSYTNLNKVEQAPQQSQTAQANQSAVEYPWLEAVGKDSYPSYLAPNVENKVQDEVYTYDTGEEGNDQQASENSSQNAPQTLTNDAQSLTKDEPRDVIVIEVVETVQPNTETAGEKALVVEEVVADPVFAGFSEDEVMSWPVLGEIVMDYSSEKMIYDKTLEQFRRNDSIAISSDVGSQVKASAEGIVRSVEKSREDGVTVVIDNGNGWSTTYSQLQDGVLVTEGDYVKPGQVIGGVGEPSIYSVLLGSHLDFKVTKDGNAVDPKELLE